MGYLSGGYKDLKPVDPENEGQYPVIDGGELTPPPTLPDIEPPAPPPDEPSPETIGLAPPETLEETNTSSAKMQLPLIANGSALPLVYGKARVGAKIGFPFTSTGTLNFPAFWCEGEIQSIKERTNGELRDPSTSYTQEQYLGEPTQPLSPILSQPAPGDPGYDEFNPGLSYTDTHDGVAYSVMFIGRDDDPRSVMAEIEGLKIYDPRDGTQTEGDPSTYKYSANPALILADFHQRYRGGFESIDWTSVGVCADHCDENIGTVENPVPRSEIGYVVNARKTWKQYFEAIREYALCYTYYDDNTLYMVPDKAATVEATLTESDIIEGSLNLKLVDANQVPDQTIVQYTSTANEEWTDATAETPAPTGGAKNPSVVNMNAWQSHQAAYRYAILRQNKHNMINLVGSFKTFDEGLAYHAGSVIELSHSRGLSQKKFTVLSVTAYDLSRYEVQVIEYQPVWSDVLQEEAFYPDTNLPTPFEFPTVENLAGVEKLWADETGKYHTVFEITFDGGDWPHTGGFRYSVGRVSDGQKLIESTLAYKGDVTHRFATPPTTQGEAWVVTVWVVNKYNSIDTATKASIQLVGDGKSIPPDNIPAGTLKSVEFGQFVRLTWDPAADSDLSGYEVVRLSETDYDADVAASNDPFDNANTIQMISRIDAEVALLGAQPTGTFAYGVRPIDRAGNKALGRWTKQLVTAENSGAISEQPLDLDESSLISMSVHEEFGVGKWAYTNLGDSWVDRFGNAAGAWPTDQTEPWIHNLDPNYLGQQSAGTEEWDTGSDRTSDWIWNPANVRIYGSAPVVYATSLATAAAYPTFTTHSGRSANESARYMKGKAYLATMSNRDEGFAVLFPADATFQSVVLNDQVEITVLNQLAGTNFSWNADFSTTPRYWSVLKGTDPVIIAFETVDKDGGIVKAFDPNGDDTSADIIIYAEGT